MVHVEIYMGGESSLGARWHSGAVSIFPSYKFESSNYYNIKFHYKSIDVWLSGICRYNVFLKICRKFEII